MTSTSSGRRGFRARPTDSLVVFLFVLVVGARGGLEAAWNTVRDLFSSSGGYIHPALRLVERSNDSKGRCLEVVEAVAANTILISVPQNLMISRYHSNGSILAKFSQDGVGGSANISYKLVLDLADGLGLYPPEELEPDRYTVGPDVPVAILLAKAMYDDGHLLSAYLRLLRNGPLGHHCELPPGLEDMSDEELARVLHEKLYLVPPFFSNASARMYDELSGALQHLLPVALEGVSLRRFMQAYHIMIARSFSVWGVRVLIPGIDFVNHEVDGNAFYTQDYGGTEVFSLLARRDIERFEEVTITYSDDGNAQMYETYGFTVPPHKEPRGEWNWNADFKVAFRRDPPPKFFSARAETFRTLADQGYDPLTVLRRVLAPKLHLASSEEDFDVEEQIDVCDLHRYRVRLSERRAIEEGRTLLEAAEELAWKLGDVVVNGMLAAGDELLFGLTGGRAEL